MEEFKKCKSYSEMGELLGYNYYNGRVKKEVIKFCELNNLNPELIIEENSKKPNKCLFCGKEIDGKNRFTRKFCNSSCAASFNNKGRKHTEETKEKIQYSLLKKNNENVIVPNLKELINDGLIRNPYNYSYKNIYVPPCKYELQTCLVCGKEFRPCLTKQGLISKSNTCSDNCRHLLISKK